MLAGGRVGMRETFRSGALFFEAKKMLPGGVSSPVHAFDPYPIYIRSGKGAIITDVDDNEYIDYCMAYGVILSAMPTRRSHQRHQIPGRPGHSLRGADRDGGGACPA